MCGIIGVLSSNTIEIIKKGLIELQNRGYDSVGVSVMSDEFKTIKYSSNDNDCFENLLNNIHTIDIGSKIGIGHTRWATHGKKSVNNSHPHLSFHKNIILVHNGIIENHKKIKNFLLENNYIFYSETDSEVIVNLIDYYYNIVKIDFEEILKKLENELEGTWALVLMNINFKNKLFCCRNGSPLLIGFNDDCVIISSEKSAFNNYVKKYFVLGCNDVCSIEYKLNNIVINTKNNYEYINNYFTSNNGSNMSYKYWIEKEIYEQYESSLKAISIGGRLLNKNQVILEGLEINNIFLKSVENLLIVGCGTSYHSGMLSKYYFNDLCNFNNVNVIDGGEFNINDICKKGITAIILLSQSGETKDIYDCLKIAKQNKIFTIGIVNSVDSMIARETDCGCYINAGTEKSVASTKSFTNQVVVLSMVAIWFAQLHNINYDKRLKYINNLMQLPYNIKDILDNQNIDNNIIELLNKKNLFILGKEKGEIISKEGSLKIKEIAYIHAEGYSSSALKHGPYALLEKNTPVILLLLNNIFYAKNCVCYEEIKSRESPIVIIKNNDRANYDKYDYEINIPYNEIYNELLSVIPLQIIAYKLSIMNNINPDKPRNLAKCVTTD